MQCVNFKEMIFTVFDRHSAHLQKKKQKHSSYWFLINCVMWINYMDIGTSPADYAKLDYAKYLVKFLHLLISISGRDPMIYDSKVLFKNVFYLMSL